jgi:hypothetical protein
MEDVGIGLSFASKGVSSCYVCKKYRSKHRDMALKKQLLC